MFQPEYHKAAEKRILKMLYCAQEKWQQKSVPASGIFLKIKPDSNDEMNQK